MWGSRIKRPITTHALLALALIACVMRSLVPQGYMVESGARPGEVIIAFCSEHGTGQAAFDLETGAVRPLDTDGDDDERAAPSAPCVFAQAAVAAPPTAIAALAAPIGATLDVADHRVASVHVGRGLAAPPPPARGPPILI